MWRTFIFMLILYFLKFSAGKGSLLSKRIQFHGIFPEKIILNNIIWNRDNLKINYSLGLMHIPITTFWLPVGLHYIPFSKIREEKVRGRNPSLA
jgi:hypothetical protein